MPRIKDKLKKSIVDQGLSVKIVGASISVGVIHIQADKLETPRVHLGGEQKYPGKARHYIHIALPDGTSFQAEVDEFVHAELEPILRDRFPKEP
jgi:hypothetical protein